MPLIDYFAAADDAAAARVLDGAGGPEPLGLATLPAKGIDPATIAGKLEALLTGRPHKDVAVADRQCKLVADADGEALVVTVTDTLRDALAGSDADGRRRVAGEWADTDELRGADPAALAEFLDQFAAFAADARAREDRLYCWWAL